MDRGPVRFGDSETFATYVGVGERLQFTLMFVEVEMQMAGAGSDDRSYVINAGLGFF